jgi:hypothetical protein
MDGGSHDTGLPSTWAGIIGTGQSLSLEPLVSLRLFARRAPALSAGRVCMRGQDRRFVARHRRRHRVDRLGRRRRPGDPATARSTTKDTCPRPNPSRILLSPRTLFMIDFGTSGTDSAALTPGEVAGRDGSFQR